MVGRLTSGSIGNTIPLAGLAPGPYTIGLFAHDSDGNVSSTAVQFDVLPLAVPDGVVDSLDGLGNDPGYADAPVVRFVQSPEREARFVHANGHLYVSVSGLRVSDPNAIAASLQILIDTDASGGSAPQSGDVGFMIDEGGFVTQLRGNGSGMVAESSPAPALRSEILRSENTWDVELAIPDSLLGGWNHAARLMLYYQRYFWVAGSGISFPDSPSYWPFANPNQPATWGDIYLGPLPVISSNNIPHAVAIAPAVISLNRPEMIQLDGSGSYDPDGDPLTYSWSQIAGPTVALSSATAVQPTFTTPNVALTTTLRFQLIVNDGEQSSAPATVSVTLIPLANPPVNGPIVSVNKANGSATARLTWGGAPGDRVLIQASTDLVHWVDVGTNTVGFLESILYTDSRAGLFPYRFYRARLLPSAAPPTLAQLRFDGVDDVVEVPHDSGLNVFPLTVALWLKTADTGFTARGLASKYADNSADGYSLVLSDGRVRAWYFRNWSNYIWDGDLGLDGGFVADDHWHHIALVVDALGGRLYVDGSLKSSLAWLGPAGATTSTQPLQFGRYFNYPVTLNGLLDEIALWNRALTEAEINQMIPGKLTGAESGLLGFWPFDEGAGQTAADASGHGRHGTLSNGPQWFDSTAPLWPNPAAGTAVRFDGVDDAVQVAHNVALNPFPLTIAAWVKTAQNSPGYVSVFNKYPAGSGNGYSLHIHNGRLAAFFFCGDGASYLYAGDPGLDGGFIADGQWHHVAYVVDASGARIYVDGVQIGNLGWTGTPGPCTTASPVTLGLYPAFGQNISLDGRLEEVTLWNRALDATDINTLMHTRQTGSEPGLVGYWPFDNGAGTTATDVTGHGHNGTLQFGPLWVPSDAPVYP